MLKIKLVTFETIPAGQMKMSKPSTIFFFAGGGSVWLFSSVIKQNQYTLDRELDSCMRQQKKERN